LTGYDPPSQHFQMEYVYRAGEQPSTEAIPC
jgi:hypothetical protein